MAFFELLAGLHSGPDYSKKPVQKKDGSGEVISERYPSKVYKKGQVVEDRERDLVELFGAEKFRLVEDRWPLLERVQKSWPPSRFTHPHGQVPEGKQVAANSPDGPPFADVETDENAPSEEAQAKAKEAGGGDTSGWSDEDLDNMNLHDLRQLAGEEEVDITGLRTKEEIKQAIRESKAQG